jgi:hypothetical protein
METLNLYGSIPIIVSCWSFSPIKLYLEFAQDGIIVEQHPCHLRLSKKIGSYRQEYIQATCQMRKKHWKTILPFTQIFYCCKELNTRVDKCLCHTNRRRKMNSGCCNHSPASYDIVNPGRTPIYYCQMPAVPGLFEASSAQ